MPYWLMVDWNIWELHNYLSVSDEGSSKIYTKMIADYSTGRMANRGA